MVFPQHICLRGQCNAGVVERITGTFPPIVTPVVQLSIAIGGQIRRDFGFGIWDDFVPEQRSFRIKFGHRYALLVHHSASIEVSPFALNNGKGVFRSIVYDGPDFVSRFGIYL